MIFMESPTNRIKEVLIEKGIKQTWLAEILGQSFTIVRKLLRLQSSIAKPRIAISDSRDLTG